MVGSIDRLLMEMRRRRWRMELREVAVESLGYPKAEASRSTTRHIHI